MTPPDLVALALAEDVGPGDVTSEIFVPPERQARAAIIARSPCVLAGMDTAREVFARVDPAIHVTSHRADGDHLDHGDAVLTLDGTARGILTAERVALNFLQRLSGIATLTRQFVQAIAGTNCKILDTRKTTPGWRLLEKQAVAAGGGTNHRMGLHDMVMVKDNHLACGGGPGALQPGIEAAKARGLRVEVEVDTLAQFAAVAALRGVDIILLDNMTPAQLSEAVAKRPPGVLLEASGGITLANVAAIARTGIDFISIGALTHSAPAVDLGMDLASTTQAHVPIGDPDPQSPMG